MSFCPARAQSQDGLLTFSVSWPLVSKQAKEERRNMNTTETRVLWDKLFSLVSHIKEDIYNSTPPNEHTVKLS